jgi:hypothetical protein
MEWDQITDRWAAMTYRLRGNMAPSPKEITGRHQPSQGAPRAPSAEAPGPVTVRLAANDHSQPLRR